MFALCDGEFLRISRGLRVKGNSLRFASLTRALRGLSRRERRNCFSSSAGEASLTPTVIAQKPPCDAMNSSASSSLGVKSAQPMRVTTIAPQALPMRALLRQSQSCARA